MSFHTQTNKAVPPHQSDRILFEGFGGTGKLAVLEQLQHPTVLTLIEQGQVQVSVLDIDPDQETVLGDNFYWLGKDVQTHSLFEQYRTNLEQYPGCEHLGDVDLLHKATGKSNQLLNGAQTAPPLGAHALLCQLWWRWLKLVAFLMRTIMNLTTISAPTEQEDLTTGERRPSQIIIVQSTSADGGTGSGIFMDLADLRHDTLKKSGIQQYEIYLDLFLPGGISRENQERIQANTWSRFLQLSHRYQVHNQSPRQLGRVTLSRKQPPWAGITVWNITTTEGETYSGREALVGIQGEVNRMKYLGPMGAVYQARLVDLSEHDDEHFLSAAGGFSYVIEVDALKDIGTAQLGQQIIRHYLLRTLPETTAKQTAVQQVQDFVHQTKLTNLVQCFTYDTAGRQLLVRLDPVAFQQIKRQDLPPILTNWRRDFLETTTKELTKLVEREQKRLMTHLVQFSVSLLNDPNGGVIQLEYFLEGLLDWVQEQIQQQRRLREHQADSLATHIRAMRDTRFLRRLRQTTWSKEGFLKKGPEREFNMELRLEQIKAELEVWMALAEQIQQLQKAQQRWLAVCQQMISHLTQRQEQALNKLNYKVLYWLTTRARAAVSICSSLGATPKGSASLWKPNSTSSRRALWPVL